MRNLLTLAKAYTIASDKTLNFLAKMESAKTESSRETSEYRYVSWSNKATDAYRDIQELIASGATNPRMVFDLVSEYPIMQEFV